MNWRPSKTKGMAEGVEAEDVEEVEVEVEGAVVTITGTEGVARGEEEDTVMTTEATIIALVVVVQAMTIVLLLEAHHPCLLPGSTRLTSS